MAYESDSAGSRWIREHWSALSQEYRHRWIASEGSELVAADEDLSNVLARLQDDRRSVSDVAIAFVDGQEFEPGV
ncbi:DUF5678 domain-containing protein [Nocardia sp. NPDC049526]|uniref:DUF5678 domain-containing protein n=1 Tax=Nocardia sp. NPDC049526 TaxID=3364316 RepID=UPI0037B34753